MALAPGDADFLSTRLSILRDQGRFAESVVAGTRGLEADPLSVACLNQLTFTYWFQGDLKRARASNDRAFEVSPDSRTARFNRCALDIAEGQEQAAREHCLALPKSVQPFYSALLAKKWGTPWRPRWPTSARAARGRSPSCMPFTARPTGPSIGSSGPSSATISKG